MTDAETTSKRSAEPALQRGGRGLAFAGLFALVFVAMLGATSTIRHRGWPLIAYLTNHLVEPGGTYHSLQRFREAASHEPVDVVVFGSSHAYRGYDPRLFEARGYSLFNLGSTNQTPLNSRFLAERYLRTLKPRLVIYEVYYATLQNDGFESCRDLAVNTPWSWAMQRMALSTRHLGAMNFTTAKGLGFVGGLEGVEQRAVDGERYVPGGYVDGGEVTRQLTSREPIAVDLFPRQIDALVQVTDRARRAGARVVWVTHPVADDHRRAVTNYDEVHDRIEAAARRAEVAYWRFDERLELDAREHFADFHHLDAEGVAIFNEALLDELLAEGLLDGGVP